MFETLYADPARLKEFLKAMSGISRGAAWPLRRSFRGRSTRRIVDVGTAQGDTAAQLLLTNPAP